MERSIHIDPATAKIQAYALFDGRILVGFGRCKLDELDALIGGVDYVTCEDQHLRFARVTINLAHVAGRVEEKARRCGKDFSYIQPTEWQGAILKAGPGVKAKERTRRSKWWARRFLEQYNVVFDRGKEVNEDVASAINIGMYATSRREALKRGIVARKGKRKGGKREQVGTENLI